MGNNNDLVNKINRVLSEILSDKYECDITITLGVAKNNNSN